MTKMFNPNLLVWAVKAHIQIIEKLYINDFTHRRQKLTLLHLFVDLFHEEISSLEQMQGY